MCDYAKQDASLQEQIQPQLSGGLLILPKLPLISVEISL
ncbi:hypothetical protein AM1_F0181 (plasmid) [Acaryochloris marina MBIC11017]|uniref:Uncharacterized protein n=1 Tax=Acaryochloris marina (strain MBIC 11017) TaxID=329726 RepID=A8ZPX4_ACAM1|nr:hypothetical protein AM1_F0181 [Acaryochloris marina MBIC11017]